MNKVPITRSTCNYFIVKINLKKRKRFCMIFFLFVFFFFLMERNTVGQTMSVGLWPRGDLIIIYDKG